MSELVRLTSALREIEEGRGPVAGASGVGAAIAEAGARVCDPHALSGRAVPARSSGVGAGGARDSSRRVGSGRASAAASMVTSRAPGLSRSSSRESLLRPVMMPPPPESVVDRLQVHAAGVMLMRLLRLRIQFPFWTRCCCCSCCCCCCCYCCCCCRYYLLLQCAFLS
jgi:hypothetical protein